MPDGIQARSDQSNSRKPTLPELAHALRGLLGALDKQTFPNASPVAHRCHYSLNVEDAMVHARGLLKRLEPIPPLPGEPDPRDLARPKAGTK